MQWELYASLTLWARRIRSIRHSQLHPRHNQVWINAGIGGNDRLRRNPALARNLIDPIARLHRVRVRAATRRTTLARRSCSGRWLDRGSGGESTRRRWQGGGGDGSHRLRLDRNGGALARHGGGNRGRGSALWAGGLARPGRQHRRLVKDHEGGSRHDRFLLSARGSTEEEQGSG